MMAPAVVAWHNSGYQPQQYSLFAAISAAAVGSVCVMLLFITILRGK